MLLTNESIEGLINLRTRPELLYALLKTGLIAHENGDLEFVDSCKNTDIESHRDGLTADYAWHQRHYEISSNSFKETLMRQLNLEGVINAHQRAMLKRHSDGFFTRCYFCADYSVLNRCDKCGVLCCLLRHCQTLCSVKSSPWLVMKDISYIYNYFPDKFKKIIKKDGRNYQPTALCTGCVTDLENSVIDAIPDEELPLFIGHKWVLKTSTGKFEKAVRERCHA